jgi:hypothetical protein
MQLIRKKDCYICSTIDGKQIKSRQRIAKSEAQHRREKKRRELKSDKEPKLRHRKRK